MENRKRKKLNVKKEIVTKEILKTYKVHELKTYLKENNVNQYYKFRKEEALNKAFDILEKELYKKRVGLKVLLQTQILQQILQFIEPINCFRDHRYVCKSWNQAIENIRFEFAFWQASCVVMTINENVNNYCSLYLKNVDKFKKIQIDLSSFMFGDEPTFKRLKQILLFQTKKYN